jgi:hypothetical protein
MKKYILIIAFFLVAASLHAQKETEELQRNYDEIAHRIIDAAMADTSCLRKSSRTCAIFSVHASAVPIISKMLLIG